MNLLEDLVNLYKDSEAPEIFFYWAGISAISAIVKKNVYLDRAGIYNLYPNIYCFLIAQSGMKKGVPIHVAKTLVSEVNNTRIISGRNSIQQVLDDLGRAYSQPDGTVIREAQGYLISSELAAFLIKDIDALTILTDIFDTQYHEKEWKYSLRSGKVTLHQPCVSLLAASNEEHFAEAVTRQDVTGGFIARTFIVFSNERGKPNSLVKKRAPIKLDNIVSYLKEIAKIKGEFKWSNEAGEYYDEWYNKLCSIEYHDPTGSMNRIGDQVLKVAMCISLANGEFPILNVQFIKEAIVRCLATLVGMRQVTMGGPASLAAQTKMVIRELIIVPEHETTRKKILSKYWGQFDAFDLDRIAETLQQAGAINIINSKAGTIYKLKEEALEQYLNYKRSIN